MRTVRVFFGFFLGVLISAGALSSASSQDMVVEDPVEGALATIESALAKNCSDDCLMETIVEFQHLAMMVALTSPDEFLQDRRIPAKLKGKVAQALGAPGDGDERTRTQLMNFAVTLLSLERIDPNNTTFRDLFRPLVFRELRTALDPDPTVKIQRSEAALLSLLYYRGDAEARRELVAALKSETGSTPGAVLLAGIVLAYNHPEAARLQLTPEQLHRWKKYSSVHRLLLAAGEVVKENALSKVNRDRLLDDLNGKDPMSVAKAGILWGAGIGSWQPEIARKAKEQLYAVIDRWLGKEERWVYLALYAARTHGACSTPVFEFEELKDETSSPVRGMDRT